MAFTNLPKLKKVTINGVDVSSYVITYETDETFDNNIKVAVIGLKSTVSDVLDYKDDTNIGTNVVIQRGVALATEKTIFQGLVRNISFQGGVITFTCEDKLSVCKYTVVNTSFDINIDSEAGVISEIAKTLVTDYTTLTADSSSFQNSGTVNVIKKFRLKQRTLMDALLELANAIDWQLYYDSSDDKVYFEPKGFTTSATTLEVSTNIIETPEWDIDSSMIFNRVIVSGSPQEIFTEEGPFQLDGSESGWTTTNITLNQKPIFLQVFSDTSNPPTTEKTGGVERTTATFDYEVNKERKIVEWSSTFTPTTSYYALIKYSFNLPVRVTMKDAASIDVYGQKDSPQFREDIKTVDDAERWASKQLEMFSTPFYSTELRVTNETDLKIGDVHTVIDSVNGVTRDLMIKQIRQFFPYNYDEVMVGDKAMRTSNWGMDATQRLIRLEEKQTSDDELNTEITQLDIDIDYDMRSMEVYKRDTEFDSKWGIGFSNGSSTNELNWADSGALWQSAWGNSEVRCILIPDSNIFQEYVYDTDYYDSTNSSGVTWDTGDNDITIASGSKLQTNMIALGQQYSWATIVMENLIGNLHPNFNIYEGLQLHYTLESDASDASGNGNDGTISNASIVSGKIGNCYESTTSGTSYIDTPLSMSDLYQKDFSFSCWIKTPKAHYVGGNGYLFSTSYATSVLPSNFVAVMMHSTGEISFRVGSSWTGQWKGKLSTSTFDDDAWHFVVATYDYSADTVKLYIDNVEQTTTYNGGAGTTTLFNSSDAVVNFGCIVVWRSDILILQRTKVLFGKLDEISLLIDRVLSVSDINTLYNSTSGLAFPWVTGTPDTVEVSQDNGSTWQNVPLATRTALTATGTTGFLMRGNAGSSGATIAVTKDASTNQKTKPAYKITLEE